MFKRAWADYEDDEELPQIPWYLVTVKPKPEAVKPVNNKFWILDQKKYLRIHKNNVDRSNKVNV